MGFFNILGFFKMKKIIASLALVSPLSAFATVPSDVTTALSSAGTDSVTVAGSVLVVIVGIFAIKLMRKAL